MLASPSLQSSRPLHASRLGNAAVPPAHSIAWRPNKRVLGRRQALCQSLGEDKQQGGVANTTGSQEDWKAQFSASQGNSGIAVQGYSPTSIKGWSKIKSVLREADVKLLSAQELSFARDRGVPIIDIRPPADFAEGHIPGAQNVPFYQPITGWSAMKLARRAGYALFGVFNGTEVNQEFTQQVAQRMKPELGGAIIYCSLGGSLDPVERSKKGLQSRSLIAAWKLVTDGYPNVSVLRGGWSEWVSNDREVAEGSD